MPRLFIAIEPPQEIKQKLLLLPRAMSGARWQSAEKMHLSLNFLGEIDKSLIPELIEQLTEIKASPIECHIKGVDYFGSKRYPRVLYAKVVASPALLKLHKQLKKCLENMGLELERQKFIPHITLARLNQTPYPAIIPFLQDAALFETAVFSVDSFHLLSSKLMSTGSEYYIEESFSLIV